MADLALGSIFAGCRLDAVGGRGGMGVVYRATQLALNRPVALKAIAPELAEDPSYRERFQREAELAASIDHPNIIPVYEAGESGGTLYLIMRWVDGTDLRSLLSSQGRLAPARALRLLLPVASALGAAHRRGLIHRDVKPANVLIAGGADSEDEHVYLTDFGIARRTEGESALTRTGLFVGTVDYAAPERIRGERGDATSDVYAVGCMLFETLTGHPPFSRPEEVARMFAHINDPVPAAGSEVAGLPECVDEIVATAMAKQPADRYTPTGRLVSALGAAAAEVEGTTTRRPAPEAGTTAPEPPGTAPAPGATVADPDATAAEPDATVAETTRETRTAAAPEATATRTGTRPRAADRTRASPRRTRRAAVAMVILVLAGGAVAAVLALGGGSRTTPPAAAAAGAEVRSSSGSGMGVAATVKLDGQPYGMTVGQSGGVWVSIPAAGQLARIAPASGAETTFHVGGQPTALAAGPTGIWVAGSSAGPLALLNATNGTTVKSTRLPQTPRILGVDHTDGSVWSGAADGTLDHMDPHGRVLVSTGPVLPAPVSLAVGEGWVWAAGGAAGSLIRIPTGGGNPAMFDARVAPIAVRLDQGVWTAHADGHLTRFDPRPGRLAVNADLAVAPELDALAAVERGSVVWAVSRQTRTLYRISNASSPAVTGNVVFATAPMALVAQGDSVWVATQDGVVTQIG